MNCPYCKEKISFWKIRTEFKCKTCKELILSTGYMKASLISFLLWGIMILLIMPFAVIVFNDSVVGLFLEIAIEILFAFVIFSIVFNVIVRLDKTT